MHPPFKLCELTYNLPRCWDGKNLDSPNHQDHVAYSGNGATGGGSCPSTHPVKLPQIMYELMWNVTMFQKDRSIWPTDGSNPFTYSMGIGYVIHLFREDRQKCLVRTRRLAAN